MNIKPGDKLAMVVKSHKGNEGAIVEILQYIGTELTDQGDLWNQVWLVRGRLSHSCMYSRMRGGDACFPDAWLRPIRDQPGNEDFVVKAPKPTPPRTHVGSSQKDALPKQDKPPARGESAEAALRIPSRGQGC